MFIDEAKVQWKAGDGGNGCLSFRRAKFEPKGGPNGGNGGSGGNLVLICDGNVADLTDFRYNPIARAGNGEHGKGSDKNGARGADKRLHLPPGTLVKDTASERIVAELIREGEEIIILAGGKGGIGNAAFKSSVNQAPRKITLGKPGEEGQFTLVLKTIADIGLVGFPNAGKSSLLRRLTQARPRTGAYPFTTLQPSVGVLEQANEDSPKPLKIADIPGLIDGAHQNRGLGHRFLRHIERCNLLLFVLDCAGVDGRNPLHDFRQLQDELKHYEPAMLRKPALVAANKTDLETAGQNLAKLRKAVAPLQLYPISCTTGDGIEALAEALQQHLPQETGTESTDVH